MFGLSGWEIAVILVVALLLFGSKLPDLAKNAGKSIKGFKDEITKAVSAEEEIADAVKTPTTATAKKAPAKKK